MHSLWLWTLHEVWHGDSGQSFGENMLKNLWFKYQRWELLFDLSRGCCQILQEIQDPVQGIQQHFQVHRWENSSLSRHLFFVNWDQERILTNLLIFIDFFVNHITYWWTKLFTVNKSLELIIRHVGSLIDGRWSLAKHRTLFFICSEVKLLHLRDVKNLYTPSHWSQYSWVAWNILVWGKITFTFLLVRNILFTVDELCDSLHSKQKVVRLGSWFLLVWSSLLKIAWFVDCVEVWMLAAGLFFVINAVWFEHTNFLLTLNYW